MSSGDSNPASGPQRSAGDGRVSFLEQALWQRFAEAEEPGAFATAWLALQCRFVPGAARGVVVLGEAEREPFVPVAYFPDQNIDLSLLSAAAERAMADRKGVLHGDGGAMRCLAYPFTDDGVLRGVVAIEIAGATEAALRQAMRQLQWGAGWMVALLRRARLGEIATLRDRSAAVLDLAAVCLEQAGFRAACNAAATELAARLDCDQVSIGFRQRGRTVIGALSFAAQFGQRMNLVRDLGAAMDEAIDQQALVVFPPLDVTDFRVVRAHGELARRHDTGHLLTVPMRSNDAFFGAVTFERPADRPFDPGMIEVCDSVAAMIGPILLDKRANDRWIVRKMWESLARQVVRLLGPGYVGRKIVLAVVTALVLFFALAKGDFRIASTAILEGAVLRSVVAPFDGYVASQGARAGQVVREGEVLATLDDEELVIERLRWETKLHQHQTEFDRALAERKRADVQIIQTQIDQANAQIMLLDAQLARITMRAPFDGVVVTGDLSQSVGAAIKRGDQLFEVAPLDAYRVALEVEESDIANIKVDQTGTVLLTALPEQPFPMTVTAIVPTTEAKDGKNVYRVEAVLDAASGELRPGMKGVAKVDVERRLLLHIWTRRMIDWMRLFVWKWFG